MTTASVPLVLPASGPAAAGLAVLQALFARLDAEGVPYCHWKSNEHLGASMAGAADLDLLVARDAALPLARVLAELGYKRFAAVPGRAYPGVEDYLGLDAATGTLAHLHVHYELTLGERYLKGYRIPWERALLARRERDETFGVWRADATSELLLLLVRATLKLRWRDRLLQARRPHALPDGMARELRWLLERTSVGAVAALAGELLGDRAAARVPALLAGGGPTLRGLRAWRATIAEPLAAWRSYGAAGALGRRWWRELTGRLAPVRRRLGRGDAPARRVLPRGGAFVAFVGADGSGKSTLTREVADWLGWKLDVVRVYGGSGADSAGLPRRAMERAAALLRRLRPPRARHRREVAGDGHPAGRGDHVARAGRRLSLARVGWVVALARERRQRAARTRRARNRGMIVLSDRLAQSQFAGINDGPHLGDPAQHASAVRRAAARYERDAFRAAERVVPDLVVRLHLPFEVAARRKPDTPPEQLRRKLAIVRQLAWPPGTRVLDVDAGRPLAEVLLDVRRAVWEAL